MDNSFRSRLRKKLLERSNSAASLGSDRSSCSGAHTMADPSELKLSSKSHSPSSTSSPSVSTSASSSSSSLTVHSAPPSPIKFGEKLPSPPGLSPLGTSSSPVSPPSSPPPVPPRRWSPRNSYNTKSPHRLCSSPLS